jgi:subtilisin family serine protease
MMQAVKWAIEQKVDVISISWITKSQFPELKEAIEEATKHALVFCSTADEGNWSNRVYPACYDGTVRVSATDKYGNLMPSSDKDAINIPVPGQDIPAFGPSYMGAGIARGTVSGSSVATALAAGIASLALLLLQVFNEANRATLKQKRFYTNEKIVSVLSRISATDKQPSLFPTRATELVELLERWDFKNFD